MKQKYRSGTYTETAGDKQNKTKEEKNMATKFPILLQIGIIVRDRDKAVAGWEKLGFKMREVGGMSGEQPPFDDLTIDGKRRAELVSKTAFFNCYGMEIELIEPVADTPYKKWLDEHGPGIHHIAVITEDSYDKVLEDYKAEKGEDPWIRGVAMGGMMDFSYLDLREDLGIIAEIYRNILPGRPGIPYEYEGIDASK